MIKSVKSMKIGDTIEHEGDLYIITKFPTRSMLCADAKKLTSRKPSHIKMSISEYVKTADIGNSITLSVQYAERM